MALGEDEDNHDNVDDNLASSLEVIPEDGEVAWKEGDEAAAWASQVGLGVFDRACFGAEDRDDGDNLGEHISNPINNNNLLELPSRTARLQKLYQLSEQNKDYNFPDGKMEAVGPWAKLLQHHVPFAEQHQLTSANNCLVGGINCSPSNNHACSYGLKRSQSGFSTTMGEETTTAHDNEEDDTATSLDGTQTNDGCHTSDGGGAASCSSGRMLLAFGGTPRAKKPCKVVLTLSCTELPLVINDDITHQLKKAGVVCVDPNLTLARALYDFEAVKSC